MRAAKVVFIIWLLAALAVWIRQGHSFCIAEALPLVERSESLSARYELYAIGLFAIGVAGYFALTAKQPRRPPTVPRRRPALITVLLAAFGMTAALALFARRIHPAVTFSDVVGPFGPVNELRYLALLGLGVLTFLILVRCFRDG